MTAIADRYRRDGRDIRKIHVGEGRGGIDSSKLRGLQVQNISLGEKYRSHGFHQKWTTGDALFLAKERNGVNDPVAPKEIPDRSWVAAHSLRRLPVRRGR